MSTSTAKGPLHKGTRGRDISVMMKRERGMPLCLYPNGFMQTRVADLGVDVDELHDACVRSPRDVGWTIENKTSMTWRRRRLMRKRTKAVYKVVTTPSGPAGNPYVLNPGTRSFPLTRGEFAIYEAAVRDGYLAQRAEASGLAWDAYAAWCLANERPFIAVTRERRTYRLLTVVDQLDLWALTEPIQARVRGLFRGLGGWVRGFVDGGLISYRGVPRARANEVVHELLGLLSIARESWKREQYGV